MTTFLVAALVVAVAGTVREHVIVRALRECAARTAHEVRGPLTAAQLALHGAARRGQVAPALVAGLELELRRAAQALEDPVGTGDEGHVDLGALLRCQVQTWQAVAVAHGAQVELVGHPEAVVARGEALRIAQALSNVVANAIEHGGGLVTVAVDTVGDRVRVEVADGGPGLPAAVADLARRPRAGRGRRGRGLAIAAGVLERFGGNVAVLPSAQGARVAIELPAAEARP
jgi:signal transduction histidine kinase